MRSMKRSSSSVVRSRGLISSLIGETQADRAYPHPNQREADPGRIPPAHDRAEHANEQRPHRQREERPVREVRAVAHRGQPGREDGDQRQDVRHGEPAHGTGLAG